MSGSESYQLFSSLQYSPALEDEAENTSICGGEPCSFYLLPYHRDRIVQAAKNFGWSEAISSLEDISLLQAKCEEAVTAILDSTSEGDTDLEKEYPDGVAVRIRVLVSKSGDIKAETNLIPFIPPTRLFPTTLDPETVLQNDPDLKVYSVYLDTQPTEASDYTRYKTTIREHYDSARARVGIKSFAEPKEVILWSTQGMVMEGSLTNVHFFRADRGGWLTPTTPGEEDGGAGGTAGTVRRWLLGKGLITVGDIKKEEVKPGEWVWLSNGVRGMMLGRVETLE